MIRKSLLASLLLGAVLVWFAGDVYAGAWTLPKYKVWGEYYTKWNYADHSFTAEGKRKVTSATDGHGWEYVTEPKIEYGVTDRFNLLSSVEYKESHYKEYGRPLAWGPFSRKHHGVTNIKVGGKYRFVDKPFVMSGQVRYFIYPGYGINHGDDNFNSNQPSIGNGNDSLEVRVLLAKKFLLPLHIMKDYKLPCYVGAETGYRWNNRHVCNDIPYTVEGGFWPVNWLLIKSEIDGYKSHDGTGSIETSYGIWRIGFAYQVFGDTTQRKAKQAFNIEVLYGVTAWGKNTTAYHELVLKFQTMF